MQTAFTTPLTVRPSTTVGMTRPAACTLRKTTLLPSSPALPPIGGLSLDDEPGSSSRSGVQAPTMRIFDWKKREDPNYGVIPPEDEGIFKLTNLRPAPGSQKRKKRKGRGVAAGGSRCGFGMRGQKSRSGRSVRPGFEGGQTPLYRRVPKFVGRPMGPGHKKTEYALIKPEFLNECEEGETVTFQSLFDAGLITKQKRKIFKVVGGTGVTTQNLTVKAHAFTSSAVEAIESANGTCVLLSPTTGKDLIFDDEGNLVSSDDEAEDDADGSDSEEESEKE